MNPSSTTNYRISWKKSTKHVAEIYSLEDGARIPSSVFKVVVDIEVMIAKRMRYAVVLRGEKELRIFVSPLFMQLPLEMREAALWHELGHIALGHLDDADNLLTTHQRRIAAIELGTVVKEEGDADFFAASNGHRSGLISFLRFLHTDRPQNEHPESRRLGCKELELRIAQLVNMRQTETPRTSRLS